MNNLNNNLIAKNTLIINFQQVISILLGLFTIRFVLQCLGASDFGLYNLLAGVLSMITFISGSMSATTTRYINFEMGKKDADINRVFNVSLIIHIFLAILVLMCAEVIGLFYIQEYLNIPIGKERDAMFVYQVSTLTACIGIIFAPYRGLLVANEKFGIMAKVEICNSFLKLGLVLSLFLFQNNALRIYSVYMVLMSATIFVSYFLLSHKYWPLVVKWRIVFTKTHYKEILTFNGYNLLGTSAIVMRDQGTNMLMNIFFGTTTNAAYAIARSVQAYVNNFMANIDVASGPQITQSVSRKDDLRSENLAMKVSKIGVLLATIAAFPLLVGTDYLLKLWLGDVPEGTSQFCKLILVLVVVSSTSAGLTQIINGSGQIKWFKIQFFALYALCIPISFYSYKSGSAPGISIVIFIVADIISRMIQLILLKRILGFNSLRFVKGAYLKPFIVMASMCCYVFAIKWLDLASLFSNFINILTTFCVAVVLSFRLGFTERERNWIVGIVRKRFNDK